MEEFVRFLFTPLLSQPDQLAINSSPYAVTISVTAADMGRVIGRGGAVISAIRQLVRAYAVTHQLPFTTITVAEPQ